MSKMIALCRNATTFTRTKDLDEQALGLFIQRFVDAGLGVYLGSGGAGEGHVLTRDELKRVYEIGVEVCKGKVPVFANPPEQHMAHAAIEHAKLAVAAGVEMVNIYGPSSLHGFHPTDDEYKAYFDEILKVIKHPVALAPNPVLGYTPKAALLADICNRYTQVAAINLSGVGDNYFIDLKENVKRELSLYVPFGSLHLLDLGATGMVAAEPNIIPMTHRKYADLYDSKDYAALAKVYADIQRFKRYVKKWHGPRAIKMAMKVFKLPGGEGGTRGPHMMPPDAEVQKFGEGLRSLRLPEIDDMARAAGLAVPA